MHARTLPGSPEGTRVRTSNGRPLSAGLSAILALLCLSFAVAIGGAAGSLTVENQTTHVVNVVIGDQTFANVAPGAEAVYRSGAAGTVNVTVSYASGQGVQGSAQRSFQFGSLRHGVVVRRQRADHGRRDRSDHQLEGHGRHALAALRPLSRGFDTRRCSGT